MEVFAGSVDHLLFRLKRNYLQLPAGIHITDFILNNGNVPAASIPVGFQPLRSVGSATAAWLASSGWVRDQAK